MATPRSANIKLFLVITAVIIVVATLLYTQYIVKDLLQREREIAALYARSIEFIANRPTDKATDQSDYSFIFDEMIRSIDFPIVLSDPNNEPIHPYFTNAKNIVYDTTMSRESQRDFFRTIISELDKEHPPIKVTLQDSIIINYVHYGESALIVRLRWLPYIEIAVAGMFIILGYIGFSYIKRNEQSNIWVGMSKETAHQLGTPISSLMGWLEILKVAAGENPKQLATLAEVERDIIRLQRVTDRFSKIGSKPILNEEDLYDVINTTIQYYKQRLPSRFGEGKYIEIDIDTTDRPKAKINRELFGWVIENLIKNAIDAMEEGRGTIRFSLSQKNRDIFVDVKDTGKGIDKKQRKDIFRPGYSTKQRGWGLGLSLSKRIIESYHQGKIFIKDSKAGKGTTFRIKLHA
jgi:hypothetical protein